MALTAVLDDPSPSVRRSLAEVLAETGEAPHHLVSALACDRPDIASLVLARSPVLSDAELIDCAAVSGPLPQCAIALRARLSARLAAALAEVGACDALVILARNGGADLPEFAAVRMLERFGADARLREALLARPRLSLPMRHRLVCATAETLTGFVVACGWLSPERAQRVAGDARERASIELAERGGHPGARQLVTHLRTTGALTAGLLLRALLSANTALFEAALVELSGLAPIKVAGLVREHRGQGFAALYRRAGLPAPLLPVFRAALAAAQSTAGQAGEKRRGGRLSLVLVERALAACHGGDTREQGKLVALLRRFHVEAAREEARQVALEEMCTRRVEEALDLHAAALAEAQPGDAALAQSAEHAPVPALESLRLAA